NKLTDFKNFDAPTAVHWHGFLQAGTSHEDGPATVNQGGIPPGQSYTYRFKAKDQAGTFWYHSHYHAQYVDGLRGAMVVYDPNDPHKALYDVDNESTVINLSDWYGQPSKIGLANLRATGSEPKPVAGLFGGTTKGVFNVEKGKRYRFRLVNSGAMTPFRVSFDKHEFDVIEVDSVNHKAVRASELTIFPGQRYSIVLKADQSVGNYDIRVKMTQGGSLESVGTLKYAGAKKSAFTTNEVSLMPRLTKRGSAPRLEDKMLHPLVVDQRLQPNVKADMTINLKFTKTTDAKKNSIWTMNGVEFLAPKTNILDAVLRKGATVRSDFAVNDNVYILDKPNAIVDLVISGSAGGFEHPFHLHGHAFSVVTAGANPIVRDVQPIGGSSQTLRFVADNPGAWFMHCHIDWHLEQGLAVIFVERPNDIR
ncbi:laccase, partial [Powellomyces hirtus]